MSRVGCKGAPQGPGTLQQIVGIERRGQFRIFFRECNHWECKHFLKTHVMGSRLLPSLPFYFFEPGFPSLEHFPRPLGSRSLKQLCPVCALWSLSSEYLVGPYCSHLLVPSDAPNVAAVHPSCRCWGSLAAALPSVLWPLLHCFGSSLVPSNNCFLRDFSLKKFF